jgi:rubrerythrin
MQSPWTLDTIPWDDFRPDLVDPTFVRLVKAAALVEYNGGSYTTYLKRVFADDPAFQQKAEIWGQEEVRHGEALARWAKLADPEFDFQAAFARFTAGYTPPLDGDCSTRGSRSGELVARCMVETATSSFYTALSKAAQEPVLRAIAHWIAADEFRHYKLLYDTLKTYQAREGLGRLGRLRVAAGRIGETEDDELSYAYYAANVDPGEPYDRKRCAAAYLAPVYRFYDPATLRRGNAMVLKAVGLPSNGLLVKFGTAVAVRLLRSRAERLALAA